MHETKGPWYPAASVDGRMGLTTALGRAAWLGAGALIAIALTVVVWWIVGDSPRAVANDRWIPASLVGVEVAIALAAMFWLTRQLRAKTAQLESSNVDLAESAGAAEGSRLQAEAEAKQKARVVALLDAALATSPVGFGFFDCDLRFLRVNAAFASIGGCAIEDHVGATLDEVSPQIANAMLPTLHHVIASRAPVVGVELKFGDAHAGEQKTWTASAYPIITVQGELFGAGMAITEVSELKRLEGQLLQAQKMEAVGRLAGGVAHDFNNLLTVINSYAELMLFDPDLEKSWPEMEEIRNAAARGARLTRQLLAFSRRQALEPQIVNPNDVLRGMDALLRRLVVGPIDVATQLSPETPLIRVDPGQLEQVVMNLAINAADAMQDGGRIAIQTDASTLNGDASHDNAELTHGTYARIRVSDTGHGMTAETVRQIFEPFFTTKEPGRGTGLGLSTVYGIVKQSGGHIQVASEPGAGSVFTVYLPAVGELA